MVIIKLLKAGFELRNKFSYIFMYIEHPKHYFSGTML